MNLIPNRIKLKMSVQHLIMIKIITDVEYLKAMRTLSYKVLCCHFQAFRGAYEDNINMRWL